MQMYGNFGGFPLVHEVWVGNIMTPVSGFAAVKMGPVGMASAV